MEKTHFSVLIQQQAQKFKDKVALRFRDYSLGEWIPITWNAFSEKVDTASRALFKMGIQEQENIGIFSQNKPECFYVDFGAYRNRAVTVPMYATSSPEQVRYILNDAGVRLIFVGEQYQYDTLMKALPHIQSLRWVVVFDGSVRRLEQDSVSMSFDEFMEMGADTSLDAQVLLRTQKASDEDLANILYTSGTTGEPKGVMLTHANYLEAMRIHHIRLTNISETDVSMSFLPLTHVFERGWTYFCLTEGIQICINLRPQDIQRSIKEVHPSLMCSVPRFWEKVYIGVNEKIASSRGMTRMMMKDALRVGKIHNLDYLCKGRKPPRLLHMKYLLYERTVFATLKNVLGLENGKFFPTAGAAVSQEVCEFAHSVGIFMMVGYGLTESTATVCCYPLEGFQLGSVGRIMPGLEVRIGDRNEILLKGKTITKGYYNKPKETAEAIDQEGWFHTGDAGYLKDGYLYLTERIKDLCKTSNGKYISPQALESTFCADKYIDQMAVIADQRKFVSALIVPNYEEVERLAQSRGIAYKNLSDLLQKPQIHEFFQERLDVLKQNFASYEQIKRFTLLAEPFSMERGELTNTLKLCRSKVLVNYKTVIDKMYED